MTQVADIVASVALIVGGLFGLIGSYGILRLRGPLQRLHAPTKATTLGVGAALIASALHVWTTTGLATWQEGLVTVFLFLTAPLTALHLAKAHLLDTPPGDLPATGSPRDWAHRDAP